MNESFIWIWFLFGPERKFGFIPYIWKNLRYPKNHFSGCRLKGWMTLLATRTPNSSVYKLCTISLFWISFQFCILFKRFWNKKRKLPWWSCMQNYGNTGCNGEVSKNAKIWLSKSIFYIKNHRNLSEFFFHWRISIKEHICCYWHFLIKSIFKAVYY